MIDTGVGQFGGSGKLTTSHPTVEAAKVRSTYDNKYVNEPGYHHQVVAENRPTRYLERIHLDLDCRIDDVYTMEDILNKLITYLSGNNDFLQDPDHRQMEFKSVSEAIDSKLRLLTNKNGDVLTKLKQLEELL